MPKVKDIMQNMEYGPAPEASPEARAWIAARPVIGHYINGRFTAPEGEIWALPGRVGLVAA